MQSPRFRGYGFPVALVGLIVEVLTADGYTDLIVDQQTDDLLVGRLWDPIKDEISSEVVTIKLRRVLRVRVYL